MSTTSPNGWPVSPNAEDLDITPLEIDGVSFLPGVRGGSVHATLRYVATQMHNRVQRLNQGLGNYGYSFRENVNSPGSWSNHASGTAIDFNASSNPNGVPTSECFTPAQIEEVHKILAEVEGRVRWGGDYQSTPDSMHFEIDVPPEELDGATPPSPEGNTTMWPIGAPEIGDTTLIPELEAMSISYPTMAAYGERSGSKGSAYWLFRPTQTARISIDALRSHFTDPDSWSDEGPEVELAVHEIMGTNPDGSPILSFVAGSASWPGGPGQPLMRNQGRVFIMVEPGKTYLISTAANANFPYIRTVVRIGDYIPDPPWQDAPLQQKFWTYEGGVKRREDDNDTPVAFFNGIYEGPDLYRAFGAPEHPGYNSAAVQCLWRHSRRIRRDGFYYWSVDGGVVYGGGGNCQLITESQPITGTLGAIATRVGWGYSAQEGLGSTDRITAQAGVSTGGLAHRQLPVIQGRNGAGVPDSELTYLPELKVNDVLEWESEESTLEALFFAWDVIDNVVNHGTGKWYVSQGYEYELNSPPPGGWWGPWGDFQLHGSMAESPESWASKPGVRHVGDTTGNPGGFVPVTPAELEADFLRFTCLPASILSATPPMQAGTVPTAQGQLMYQYIALETHIRPSRFRIWEDPGVPLLDWAGVTAIELRFEGAGRVLY